MKHFTFEKHWDEMKGALRHRYPQLSEEDLALWEGKGEELYERLREKLGLTAKDLSARLRELEAATEDRFARAKARAGEIAGEVREKATEMADEVRAKAAAAAEHWKVEAQQRARTFRSEGEQYVREHPREALFGALCAGFIAGLMLRH